jgi:hypothetical protein
MNWSVPEDSSRLTAKARNAVGAVIAVVIGCPADVIPPEQGEIDPQVSTPTLGT